MGDNRSFHSKGQLVGAAAANAVTTVFFFFKRSCITYQNHGDANDDDAKIQVRCWGEEEEDEIESHEDDEGYYRLGYTTEQTHNDTLIHPSSHARHGVDEIILMIQ